MHKVDCAVIGAGVVGLAVARALALAGREVVILEAEEAIGTHTSSRNSEVIHAGLSYPAGSLKARLCVQGKDALYRYCAERGIGYRRIGKIIVATDEAQLSELEKYATFAADNDVTDVEFLDSRQVSRLEPAVSCLKALWSPSTGIVDSHALMLSFLGDAQRHGASLAVRSPVRGGRTTDAGIALEVGDAESTTLLCASVVNAAGLFAHQVARSITGIPPASIPTIYYAKGHYFTVTGKPAFKHLVYPISREGALRAHVTIDLGGQCKFGPDFVWIDRVDYRFDIDRAPYFYDGIRRYYPSLPDGSLQPGYTGIRPRVAGPHDNMEGDFVIQGSDVHNVPGLVNLYGIESPGLTSSLAIADHVAELLHF